VLTATVLDADPATPVPVLPGRRHTGWVLASCALLLVALSWSGLGLWPLTLALLSICSLLAAGARWLMLLARAGTARRRVASRFVVAPVLVLATALVAYANLPSVARFRLTEGAFDQAVHEDDGAFVGPWLGSYRIEETRSTGDGTFFLDHDGSLVDYSGFAYLPTGPSPSVAGGGFGSPKFHHLYGDWYTFWASR
jgi:hypothetical protein